jgi:HD-GYP domain-containing protein (c-di-GMP phosphodiesterase class II)
MVVAVGLAHFAVPTGTHPLHVVHVFLRGAYLVPVVAGAVWFGWVGGAGTAAAVSATYLAHVLLSWPDQPMENANQLAMVGVYAAFGVVAGALASAEARQRKLREAVERRAQREAILTAIDGLLAALGLRDEYTRRHGEAVSRLALRMGERMGLGAEALEELRLAGLVHDLGKIGIRDDILFKPDQLSADERARIERHPSLAAQVLSAIPGAAKISGLVLSHHESPDGSGYPRRLAGEQIPLGARILHVADVYSALVDERPYKLGMSSAAALSVLAAGAGASFDARCVEVLVELLHGAPA